METEEKEVRRCAAHPPNELTKKENYLIFKR